MADGNDQRAAPFAHEEPQHAHRQQDADDQVGGDHPHRLIDEMRGIEGVLQRDVLLFGGALVDLDQLGFHRIDGGEHIGARGAEHLDMPSAGLPF